MHAEDADWPAIAKEIQEQIQNAKEDRAVADSYQVHCLFATGSLAYGAGEPHSSDLDIVIGDNTDTTERASYDAHQYLEKNAELTRKAGIPIKYVHITEITPKRKASHRAMEYQHNGRQLAKQYGENRDVETKIFDVQQQKILTNARAAQTTGISSV